MYKAVCVCVVDKASHCSLLGTEVHLSEQTETKQNTHKHVWTWWFDIIILLSPSSMNVDFNQ